MKVNESADVSAAGSTVAVDVRLVPAGRAFGDLFYTNQSKGSLRFALCFAHGHLRRHKPQTHKPTAKLFAKSPSLPSLCLLSASRSYLPDN